MMGASLHDAPAFDAAHDLRPRQGWERPLAWWGVIALCGGFWGGVLRLLGVL